MLLISFVALSNTVTKYFITCNELAALALHTKTLLIIFAHTYSLSLQFQTDQIGTTLINKGLSSKNTFYLHVFSIFSLLDTVIYFYIFITDSITKSFCDLIYLCLTFFINK